MFVYDLTARRTTGKAWPPGTANQVRNIPAGAHIALLGDTVYPDDVPRP